MRAREIIRSSMTASAVAHLSALVLLLVLTEVHPFGAVTAAEPLTVDLVSPSEAVQPARHEQLIPEQGPPSGDAIPLPSIAETAGTPPSPVDAPQAALSKPN